MKFMKYDDETSMLTLNSLDDTATFLGNVIAPNIITLENKTQAITYETEGEKTIISNNTETGNMKVTYSTETYTLTVGSHATFSGSVFFSATINGYNIETELSKLQYLSTMDDITEVGGPFRASNLVGITYDDNLNTTFFSGNLSSPNISTLEDKTTNIIRIPGTDEDPISYTEIDGVSFQTTLGRISNIEFTLSNISYDPMLPSTDISGNLTVGLLNGNKIGASNEGFGYTSDAPYIPVCKANGITEIGYRLDFHLADAAYRDFSAYLSNTALNTLRVYGTTDDSGTLETNVIHLRTSVDAVRVRILTNGYQNICVYNTAGTFTWVMDSDGTNGLERWSTTRINSINASTRTTAMTYTAGTPSNTTIAGNLTVTGVINGTLSGSQTITHKTKYIGAITPGCFVESTGLIYQEPIKEGITSTWNEPTEEGKTGYYTTTQESSLLSPYENCISIVKKSTEYNNNIIGVCTEIIDNEFLKFATHGDVLIKCVSDTYKLGDILIPTTGGYSKKANNMEIIDAMTHMIPRLKVTSVETETLDSETVCAFISL